MEKLTEFLIFLAFVFLFLSQCTFASSWISANWAGKEPKFPPGSLFWKTNAYPNCPVLYRTVLNVYDKPLSFAEFRVHSLKYVYVFLNGNQIAQKIQNGEDSIILDVEITHLLNPGQNVLIISTTEDGFSLEGGIGYKNSEIQHFSSNTNNWKVQKFPPLTVLEQEPCMQPEFDDTGWFSVETDDQKTTEISDAELKQISNELMNKRLKELDSYAKWRLKMLIKKGIAVVDWETHGWAGAERLPVWILQAAKKAMNIDKEPGYLNNIAEVLTRYVYLSDELTNMKNYVVGLQVLNAPDVELEACQKAANTLSEVVEKVKQDFQNGEYVRALTRISKGENAIAKARTVRAINELCWCLDNKFGWFDTNVLLDNNIADWGLNIESSAKLFASPLSPAALITLNEKELVIQGWEEQEPLRVYNEPAKLGPVCLWAVFNDKVKNLKPDENGTVYDYNRDGKLGENWVLLVNELDAGGHLPVQLVFLKEPVRISFEAGEKGTKKVTVIFDESGVQLFILRPFKEWRGLLRQARVMKKVPLEEPETQQYIKHCRFWSRALLNYPVTFSEVFLPDTENELAIRVADVYNYWEFKDQWDTEPIKIAPLPPLATYGLMMNYPGLEVISENQVLGSRGIWGDHIASLGQNYIVYRVPLDPIKRFGGFTSYCFGPTDIGEPGSLTEIKNIKRTGANSFRPQHNQTGERAMKTLKWCWGNGIQNVFNTDEKWIPDIVEHYRKLAEQCKDYPPDALAYDLINEPETREPRAYNALIKKITAAIREIDKKHLIYVEAMPPWGPGAKPFPKGAFETLQTTGDRRTVYSFHDYEYRLPPRWPNEEHDIRDILKRWIPAFRFSIDHRCPIHLGEFGGFEQTEQNVYQNKCTITLIMDYFKIFDQFGWHWHYYSNRGTVRVREDGSLQESYVQEAYRLYFDNNTFNIHHPN